MAAIAVNSDTLQIISVFHEFAKKQCEDRWSRLHVHGLNPNWLQEHAKYNNETELLQAFRHWLRGRNVLATFANGPEKERLIFPPNMFVHDLGFPMWCQRETRASHRMSFIFKRSFIPIFNKRCCSEAHSSFMNVPVNNGSSSELARLRWGVHCALYDCWEAYLFFVEDREKRKQYPFWRA